MTRALRLTALALCAMAGPLAAAECPTLSHSGRWTGSSLDLTVLSAQVVNHLGDHLEDEGPPRSVRLMQRARKVTGRSTNLPADRLYVPQNLEAHWYDDLVEAVREFKAQVQDLDLDCDAAVEKVAADGFFHDLVEGGALPAKDGESSSALAARAKAVLARHLAAGLAAEGAKESSTLAYLRTPSRLAWMAAHGDGVDAAGRRAVSVAASRWLSLDAQPPSGAAPLAEGAREAARVAVQRARDALQGGRGYRGPSGSSWRQWVTQSRAARFASRPADAPAGHSQVAVAGTGTGDGTAPGFEGVLLGTGDDELDQYMVKQAAY